MKLDSDKGQLLEFFLTFSRFEFALKNSGWHKPPKSNDNPKTGYRAEPDWDCFARSLNGTFRSNASLQLAKACDYLLMNPPWREIVVNNALMWDAAAERDALSDVEKLLLYVRRVRNNLFHGGDFLKLSVSNHGRNAELMEFSLIIFKECLRLAPLVRVEYEAATL
jgi:hypothetical protein